MEKKKEVDNNQLRAIIEANPLTTTQEIAKEININHSTVIWHLKQIVKMGWGRHVNSRPFHFNV